MTSTADIKNDISLLNKTLFSVTKLRLMTRIVLVVILLALWFVAAKWLLDFGAKQDYAFLSEYNTQIVSFLNSINKYIWWGAILLGNLILYFILFAWLSRAFESDGDIVPKPSVIEPLITQLSPSGKSVLRWVWADSREPIMIRDLKETRNQLRNDRVERLLQSHRQKTLLSRPSGTSTAQIAELNPEMNTTVAATALAPVATAAIPVINPASSAPEPSVAILPECRPEVALTELIAQDATESTEDYPVIHANPS